jgi:hypothetical protein
LQMATVIVITRYTVLVHSLKDTGTWYRSYKEIYQWHPYQKVYRMQNTVIKLIFLQLALL